jgi:hypothetical protein
MRRCPVTAPDPARRRRAAPALAAALCLGLAAPAGAADRPAAPPKGAPAGAQARQEAAPQGKAVPKGKARPKAAAARKKAEPPRLPFVEGDYERALADAKARNVPLVVDVWAPW